MNCATCLYATAPKEPAMAGWVHCLIEKAAWHYLRPDRACIFNPVRWVKK